MFRLVYSVARVPVTVPPKSHEEFVDQETVTDVYVLGDRGASEAQQIHANTCEQWPLAAMNRFNEHGAATSRFAQSCYAVENLETVMPKDQNPTRRAALRRLDAINYRGASK
jgi:hypothetical protein